MRAYLRPMTWGLLFVLTLAWSGPTLLAQETGTRQLIMTAAAPRRAAPPQPPPHHAPRRLTTRTSPRDSARLELPMLVEPAIACGDAHCQALLEQARGSVAPLDMRPFAPAATAAVTTPVPSAQTAAALAARAAPADADAADVEPDTATEPGQTAPPRAIERYVASLPIGSRVRVRLISGGSFNAVLMGVEQGDVIVRPRTRRAQIERRIPLAQIDFVELQPSNASRTGRVIATAAAVSAASFVTMILLLRAIYND